MSHVKGVVLLVFGAMGVFLGACDEAEEGYRGLFVNEAEVLQGQAGVPLVLEGNFFLQDETLEGHLGDLQLALLARTPSRLVFSLSPRAESGRLTITDEQGIHRGDFDLLVDQAQQLEHEPNDLEESAQLLSGELTQGLWISGEVSSGDTDLYRLALPAGNWGDLIALRLEGEPTAKGTMSVRVFLADDEELNSGSLAPGDLLELVVGWPMEARTCYFEVQGEGAYVLEIQGISQEKMAASPLQFLARGEPLYRGGAGVMQEWGCDWPIALGDELFCGGEWTLGSSGLEQKQGGDGELQPFSRAVSLTLDSGSQGLFLIGPGPRTHRLLEKDQGEWIESTELRGLESATGEEILAVHALDLDSDGREDLCVVRPYGDPHCYHAVGEGFEFWKPWVTSPFALGDRYQASVLLDGDGDGDLDWLLFAFRESDGAPVVRRLVNVNGVWELTSEESIGALAYPQIDAVLPGYFDGDKHQDLAVLSAGELWLHYGAGGLAVGAFADAELIAEVPGGEGISAADLNHDGALDFYLSSVEGAKLLLSSEGQYLSWRLIGGLPRSLGLGAVTPVDEQGLPWLVAAGISFQVLGGGEEHIGLDFSALSIGSRVELRAGDWHWRGMRGLCAFPSGQCQDRVSVAILGDRESLELKVTHPDGVEAEVALPADQALVFVESQ